MNEDNRLDALVIVGLLFMVGSALFVLAFVNIPDKNQSLFAAIVGGVIGSGLTAYVQNRWGSSKGSAAKDATITALTQKVADQ